jgi:isopentenyldiphosphate isomerase
MTHRGEVLEVFDDIGQVVRLAPRSECHGSPDLPHRAVHVIVTDRSGRILLQKRSMAKDIQPGRWDTSVGGHVSPGEGYAEAALREGREELGVDLGVLLPLHDYRWVSERETELVRTFGAVHEGPFSPDAGEVEEARFWTAGEIEARLGTGVFTPNFEEEYRRHTARRGAGKAGGGA